MKESLMSLSHAVELDRDSPIPMYFQIAQQLQAEIDSGHLIPGDPLPSELELSEVLGVSRPTVRQAIQQLVQKGLVVRRRGVGTVVTHPRIHRSAALSSFFDALEAAGRVPQTKILRLEVHPAEVGIRDLR
jgi:DNA-binding GntR family transcriptional regulator